MPFPSDDDLYRNFAEGMDEVLVFEDKREQIQNGFTRGCYDLPAKKRPRIVGRHDNNGQPLVESYEKLTSDKISRIIADRIAYFHKEKKITKRLDLIDECEKALAKGRRGKYETGPLFLFWVPP